MEPAATVPRPRPAIERLPAPHDPRADRAGFLRLDLNEDLSGPLVRPGTPRAADLSMYHTAHALRRDLAAVHGLGPEWIKVTAGADEGIYGLMRAFLDAGEAIVLPQPTFVEFPVAARLVEACIEAVPYGEDLAFPLATFQQALWRGPRMAVIVSPANPTGEATPPETILALAASAPATLLLVDEAYAEYQNRSLLDAGPPPANVAVVRTFSKAYGLAAARIGYVVAPPPVIEALTRVLPIYSLAGPSLALARMALEHRHLLVRRRRMLQQGRHRIAAWGHRHDIVVHPGAANFVLLRLGETATAQSLARELEAAGILVADRTRDLPGTLRVGVGAPRHVGAFLAALERITG